MVLQEDINLLKEKIEQADSIVVGGASGMSAASGFIFYYQEDDVFKSLAGSLAKNITATTCLIYFTTNVHPEENNGH